MGFYRKHRPKGMPIGKFGDFPGFLDHCVSVIFEFSGNEFELGENKIEREREPIIFLI